MNSSKILHIAQDEKFILAAKYLFEKAFPGKNYFVIVKPAGNPPLRYLKDDFEADYLVHTPDTVSRLLKLELNANVVVFHGLDKLRGAMYAKSPNKWKFVAIIFGAELYNDHISGNSYLGDKTSKMVDGLHKNTAIDVIKNIYRWIRYYKTRNLYDDIDMKQVVYEIPNLGFLSEITFKNFVDRGILNPESRMVPFSYYPLEFIINNRSLSAKGVNILLGNSASETNNHIEAIDFLKSIDLQGRKVIIPLSYGKPKYAKAIEKYALSNLGDHVLVLRQFMPLDQYNELLSSCEFVVMNHKRSQAMGNLIASLYMGARVFVNETDAYKYFKELGCHIFLINEYLQSKSDTLEPLSNIEKQHNRAILLKALSTQTLVNNLHNSIRNYFSI